MPSQPLKNRNEKVQSKSSESISCTGEYDACIPSSSTGNEQCDDTPKKKQLK